MKAFSTQSVVPIVVTSAVLLSTVRLRADFINFSGLTISSTPMSFAYRADDGSAGTVTVSLLSTPASGSPFLSAARGLYMGLNSARGGAVWYERLVFDRPVCIEINNFETYTSWERTHLVTDGTAWTGGFSTRPVPNYEHSDPTMGVADGLGTQSLTLYGNSRAGNGDYWPYGYFQSKWVTILDVGYGVTLNIGQAANGVDFRVVAVPEPSTIALLAVLGAACLCRRARIRARAGRQRLAATRPSKPDRH